MWIPVFPAPLFSESDAAGSIGVSENFLGKVEKGAESVQWSKLFQVLHGPGVHVYIDVPDDIGPPVAALLSPPGPGGKETDGGGGRDG
ncbi:hypothetical protein GCM10023144_47380 [Pigmentiphaga soli]|uniref:Transcriptional regulator n=1 Tax=Pigmentiphaga soli TaxID=1007095 RepID=A0ABP8HT50_9BURK